MADQRITIYCLTSPSGKRYVGQTKRTTRKRWQNHCTDARTGRSTGPLANAILKYGADAFRVEEVAVCLDQGAANDAERTLIDQMGSLAPSGYNIACGGKAGWRHHDSVRAKLRSAWAANPARRKAPSAQTRQRMQGRKLSDETRAKMSASGFARPPKSADTRAKLRAAWTPERRAAARERALLLNDRRWHGG